MKRVLSFLCAVAMVLTMCTFYMGEALSVSAEAAPAAENIVPITSFSQLEAEMGKAENVGKTLQFQNHLYASDWTFEPVDKTDMTVTGKRGGETVKISVAMDETFATVLEGTFTKENSNGYARTLKNGVNIDGNGYSIKGYVVFGNHSAPVYFITDVGTKSTVKDVVFEDSIFIVNGATTQVVPLTYGVGGKVIDCETAEDVTVALKSSAKGEINVSGLVRNIAATGKETNPTTLAQLYEGLTGGFEVYTEGLVDGCINRATLIGWQPTYGGKNDKGEDLYYNVLIGGVAVRASGGIIRNCANYGDIYASADGSIYGVGGVMGLADPGRGSNPVGYERNVSVLNCANYGNISANKNGNAAGILGYIDVYWATGGQVNIALCYNAGEIYRDNGTNHYGMVGSVNPPKGSKEIEGYKWSASLYGGTALNYSKNANTPVKPTFPDNRNTTVSYYSAMPENTGSFSLSKMFAAPNNVCSTNPTLGGKTDVTDILNTASKYIEGLRPWIKGADGNPTIDFTAQNEPVVIETVADLDMLWSAHRAFENLGSKIEINATLAKDIDLNPGYTFGYDAEKKAGTVTKDDTTYYVGYGANNLTAGKFYTEVEGELTDDTAAPSLKTWRPFKSLLVSGKPAAKKVTLNIDGAGNAIKGLYLNGTGYLGLTEYVSDIHFSNLTVDGLIVNTAGSSGTSAFFASTYSDCSVIDCVSNAVVLQKADVNGTATGAFFGTMGMSRGEDNLLSRFPNRVAKAIGCTNNGTVAIYSNTKTNSKVGGVVGHMYMGEVSYCTNSGNIFVDGSAYHVSGVVGLAEGGTNYNVVANATTGALKSSYGSDTSNWKPVWDATNEKYKDFNVAAPLQSIFRIIGNVNTGSIAITGSASMGSVYGRDLGWISDGAWGLPQNKPTFVLPSESVLMYNFGISTGKATSAVGARGGLGATGFIWKDGEGNAIANLDIRDRNAGFNAVNKIVSADTSSQITTVIDAYPAATSYDRGYMIWLDYDYSNKAIPHAIKVSDGTVEGITLAKSGAKLEIGIGNKDALMLLNDTVNYLPTRDAVVNGVEVDDIYDVYDIGATAAEDIENVTAYLNEGRNGCADIGQLKNAIIKITADIDLGGAQWRPLGDDVPYFNVTYPTENAHTSLDQNIYMSLMKPVYSLQAQFNGQNYTISNFTFPRDSGVAFFGALNSGDSSFITVNNIKFANVNIESEGKYVAIFACQADHINTHNIIVEETCSISAKEGYSAGIVIQQNGEMIGCKNYADITSEAGYVAGVSVKNFCFNIQRNENYGNISSSTTGSFVGGVVAYARTNWNEYINNKNYGDIYAPNASKVGGVMGEYSSVNGSTATHSGFENHGNVTGGINVGGVIGYDQSYNVKDIFDDYVNAGNVTGIQFVGGVVGFTRFATINSATNSGTITGKGNPNDYNNAQAGGIVGRLYAGGTIQDCENTGKITVTQQNRDMYFGGIVGSLLGGTNNILRNVNRGTIDANGSRRAAGIVGAADGNALIEGNVNHGDIINVANQGAGIIAWVNVNGAVVKGNVNYGNVVGQGSSGVMSGIVAELGLHGSVICYNVNHGKVTVANAYHSGSILGRNSFNPETGFEFPNLTPTVYGNIDATGMKIVGVPFKSLGFAAYNYTPALNSDTTLIDGEAASEDNFKFGQVADIINNISFKAENFLADSGEYLYAEGSDEKIVPTNIKGGLTAGDYVAPASFEEEGNYMVQTIGVDAYPLPKIAAELIYADRVITAPAGKLEVAPAAPATEGTEKFVGYIDYDRNLYNVGDTIAGGAYLYPITVDFYTAYGAGARTTYPTGIRFQTLVKDDSLAMMNGKLGASNFGTIILPTSYVDAMMSDELAGTYNKKLDVQQIIANGVKHVDIENNGWASAEYGAIIEDGYNTYMGSLVNILETNYAKAFTGISYLKVTYADDAIGYITADWQTEKDGSNFVNGANYSKAANSREVRQIAFRALNDQTLNLSETVRQTLEAYRGSYTE